jgi:Spy/CpxP family protein refolding chaperone
MMVQVRKFFIPLLLIVAFSSAGEGWAQMKGMDHGEKGQEDKMGMTCCEKMGSAKKHGEDNHGAMGPGHLFGPNWRETLTQDQKDKADRMHAQLKKDMTVLESRVKQETAELNDLVLRDRSDMKEVQEKIDKIVDLKRSIMQRRYAHIAEMREMLTPQQRLSFDMGVIRMMGEKKGHGGM